MDSSSKVSRSDAVPPAKPRAEAVDPSRSDKGMQLSGPVWLAELGRPQSELALYDSPYSHYSEWVEICSIVKGRVQLTSVHALNIKGRDEECPLGVAPGSMLQQLMTEDLASKKQE
ncbi:g6485 [Coccomyxa viridis]|uniref:G6485 protein n=1 Tax=Coccomyxa viridis TaxID=1274662 RepID=A0ABP1FVH6_9CHLO